MSLLQHYRGLPNTDQILIRRREVNAMALLSLLISKRRHRAVPLLRKKNFLKSHEIDQNIHHVTLFLLPTKLLPLKANKEKKKTRPDFTLL